MERITMEIEWISSDNELPEEGEGILAYWYDGTVALGSMAYDEDGDWEFLSDAPGYIEGLPDFWCYIPIPEEEE